MHLRNRYRSCFDSSSSRFTFSFSLCNTSLNYPSVIPSSGRKIKREGRGVTSSSMISCQISSEALHPGSVDVVAFLRMKYTRLPLENCSLASVQCSQSAFSFSAPNPNTRLIKGSRSSCTFDRAVFPFHKAHPSLSSDSKSYLLLAVIAATDHTPFPNLRKGNAYSNSASINEALFPLSPEIHIYKVTDLQHYQDKRPFYRTIQLIQLSKVDAPIILWNYTMPDERQNQFWSMLN